MNKTYSFLRRAAAVVFVVICLVTGAADTGASTYYHTLSGSYTFGVPGSYKETSDYTSKRQRANFRSVFGIAMGSNALFRSCQPYDHGTSGRYADGLMEKYEINYVINLVDNEKSLAEVFSDKSTHDSYYYSLYKKHHVLADQAELSFKTDTQKKNNRNCMILGMKYIASHSGPYLVHCAVGKDRTGEFCMIAAALCGASYYDLLRDYRQSYINYSKSATSAEITAYCKKNLDYLLQAITYEPTGSNWRTMNLEHKIRRYLIQGGMTTAEVCLARRHLKQNYA